MNTATTTSTTTLFRPCEPHLQSLRPLLLLSPSSSTLETTLYHRCRHTPIGITSGSSSSSRRRRRRRSTSTLVMATSVGTDKEQVVGVVQGKLQKGIAEFYDESSKLWEDIWGDHMHHGFYDSNVPASLSDHRSAQFRMIEETLKFAGLPVDEEEESDSLVKRKPKSIVDVGCGIGGSSRYLAKKYGAKCQGITLSPIQAQRAQALAVSEGLADNVSFQVADALQQPFPDGEFDIVWSMESGEHMPDKAKFVNELVRVAAPGATIIIVTWCHRNLSPTEDSLNPSEKALLDKICNAYYLPDWCSTADYVKLLESHSLQDIKTADWSKYVAPFWPAVIRSALSWKGMTSLLRTGWKTIKGALAMPLMIQGFQKNLITFAIITCRKPE